MWRKRLAGPISWCCFSPGRVFDKPGPVFLTITFNFYEYYPKKPKANTMDVYSYIKHLLKLTSDVFTKNQLNEATNIGGGTISNYVVGMENIGLVVNTKEKAHNGVLYRINDPKVVYAIKNHLDISR